MAKKKKKKDLTYAISIGMIINGLFVKEKKKKKSTGK